MRWRLGMMALVVTLAGAAAPAHAITRKQAVAAALAELQPGKVRSRTGVVVYGTEHAIHAGHDVWAETVPKGKKRLVRATVRPLAQDAWLFWMDPTWGAKFGHRSTMLLIGDRNGAVLRRSRLDYWPVVDGTPPPFVTWGRYEARFQVLSSVPGGSTGQPLGSIGKADTALTRAAAPSIQAPRDSLDGDCILTIGEGSDVKASADFPAVHQLAQELADAGTGLQHWRAGNDSPTDWPDGSDLRGNVAWAVNDEGCKDVMLFIDGHGTKEGNGPPSVYVGRTHYAKDGKNPDGTDKWKSDPALVTADDLKAIVDGFPTTTFKIKIDACYSGRFIAALPKNEHPNIHILETSSSATEISYFYVGAVKDGNGKVTKSATDNPGNAGKPGRSEFTNGNLHALRDFFTSSAKVNAALASHGSLLAEGLTYAAQNDKAHDFAAQTGMTHPQSYSDQPPLGFPPPNAGAVRTLGSDLQAIADAEVNEPEDTDVWQQILRFCIDHPKDERCRQVQRDVPGAGLPIPEDGQILAFRVKGTALASTQAGSPAPLTQIHFQALRPQPDGSMKVIISSQAFDLPVGGDPNQITEYKPENFCVQKGDVMTLSTEGGFEPTFYPQGVSYQIFGHVPGSQIAFYSKHNGVMNGAQFTGTTQNDTELLMQWDLGTGDQATKLCPGGTAG